MKGLRAIRNCIGLLIIFSVILKFNVFVVKADGNAVFSLAASMNQVRQGDTVTITGIVSTSTVIATFDLDIVYDPGKLELLDARAGGSVSAGELDIAASSGKIQFLYLDDGGGLSGITGGNIFQLSFRVIGGQAGDTAGISSSIRTVGNAQAQAMAVTGSGVNLTIAAPLSVNNKLSALTISNEQLSPAFSADTVNYQVTVPYAVERINIQAAAQDPRAAVQVANTALAAGQTTGIRVIVTAESGAQKIYTISVKRGADPNYVPDSDATLSALSTEGFMISPAFKPDQSEYIVYLPYEVDTLTVTATAASAKAKGVKITGQTGLTAGKLNLIEITVAAEDNSEQIYYLAAYRAQAFDSLEQLQLPDQQIADKTADPTPAPSVHIPVETAAIETAVNANGESADDKAGTTSRADKANTGVTLQLPWVIAIIVTFALTAAALVFSILKIRKVNKSQ